MAITQKRLIDLLEAVHDSQNAFIKLVRQIGIAHQYPGDPLLEHLTRVRIEDFLEDPVKFNQTVILEDYRNQKTIKYNQEREAARNKKKPSPTPLIEEQFPDPNTEALIEATTHKAELLAAFIQSKKEEEEK